MFSLISGVVVADDKASDALKYRFPVDRDFGFSMKLSGAVGPATFSESAKVKFSSKGLVDELTFAGKKSTQATGTAFLVEQSGVLATCAHVVHGATEIKLFLDGKEYTATVVDMDEKNDLALLKLSVPNADFQVRPLQLSHATDLKLGQSVRVIGFPLSDVLGKSVKMSGGSVAGFLQNDSMESRIQLDAAINSGNSGGPVVDDSAQVVGIASAKLIGREVSKVGFAIPVSALVKLMQKNGFTPTKSETHSVLTGPEVAKSITPSVAFVNVTLGPSGVGLQQSNHLTFSGTRTTTVSLPQNLNNDPLHRMRNAFDGMRGLGGTRGFGGSAFRPGLNAGIGLGRHPAIPGRPTIPVKKSSHAKLSGKLLVGDDGEFVDGDVDVSFGPLGSLSHFLFGPLNSNGQSEWKQKRAVLNVDSQTRKLSLFSEVRSYKLVSSTAKSASIKTTYSLAPDDATSKAATHTGSGVITFDRTLGLPTKIVYEGQLAFHTEKSVSKIRMKAECNYFDAHKLQEAARLAQQKKAKQKQDAAAARKKLTDEVLQMAKTQVGDDSILPPLPDEHVDLILGDLRSRDKDTVAAALDELKQFSPGERSKQVSERLLPLLRVHGLQSKVAALLSNWATEANVLEVIDSFSERGARSYNFLNASDLVLLCKNHHNEKVGASLAKAYANDDRRFADVVRSFGTHAEEGLILNLPGNSYFDQRDSLRMLAEIGTEKTIACLKGIGRQESIYKEAKKTIQAIADRLNVDPYRVTLDDRIAKLALAKQYETHRKIDALGSVVDESTPLFLGQIMIGKYRDDFFPVEVVGIKNSGLVDVHYRGWSDSFDRPLARQDLRMAPAELPQPNKPQGHDERSMREQLAKRTLRKFLFSYAMVDRMGAEPVTLHESNSDDLWSKVAPPRLAEQGVAAWAKTVQMELLKPGDQFTLPSGRSVNVNETHVNENKLLLKIEGQAVPFILVLTQAGWKVDARVVKQMR